MADADLLINVGTSPKDPFADVKESLKDLDDGIEGAISGFKGIAAASAGVAALAGAFNFVLDATRETEDLTTQFVRFTGSVETARAQLDALKNIEGPSLPELAEANRTLFAFGVSAQNSIGQIKALADVASGSGAKVNELAEIFGKIQFEGNLTAETFSKLQKQVPGLAKDIAIALDVPEQALKSLAATGEITSSQIIKSLEKMTSEGGRYFGAADASTLGLSGSLGELQENVTKLAAEIGGRLTPAMAESTNVFSELINGVTEYLSREREIGNSPAEKKIRSLNEEIERTSNIFQNMMSISKMDNGFAKMVASFPFNGSEGVTRSIDNLKNKIQELVAERNKLIDSKQAEAAAAAAQQAADAEQDIRDKAAEKERAKLLEAQTKQREDRAKADEEKKKKIVETEKQIGQLKEAEQAVALQRETLLIQQHQERVSEENKKAAGERLRLEQELATGIAVQRSNAEIADEVREAESNERRRVAMLESVTARESELTAARTAAEASRQELLGQFEAAEVIRAQDTQRKITETQKKAEAERLAVIRKAQKDEFDIFAQTAQAQKQWDEQTYAQRLATAQAGLNALAGLMKSKNREAFEVGKAAAIAQALVAIPATAIEAYKSLAGVPLVGPGLGAAAAAAAVVAGMEQVRTIQSQRLALAEGGIVPGTGNRDTVPALLTPGEVVVPKNNFNDLQDAFVRGAVADDQVMLLQAGNNIQMRILDTLTYGTINEKLTSMLAALDRLKDAVGNISLGGGAGSVTTDKTEQVAEAIVEINKNIPASQSGRSENEYKKSTADRR